MDATTIAIHSLWGGVFAASLAIRLTAPQRLLLSSFIAGATGRLVSDVLVSSHISAPLSTGLGAVAVILITVFTIHSAEGAPAVVISGVLPLAAVDSLVKAMWHLLTLPSLQGEEQIRALTQANGDVSQVFITAGAIAAGVLLGIVAVRLFRREEIWT